MPFIHTFVSAGYKVCVTLLLNYVVSCPGWKGDSSLEQEGGRPMEEGAVEEYNFVVMVSTTCGIIVDILSSPSAGTPSRDTCLPTAKVMAGVNASGPLLSPFPPTCGWEDSGGSLI